MHSSKRQINAYDFARNAMNLVPHADFELLHVTIANKRISQLFVYEFETGHELVSKLRRHFGHGKFRFNSVADNSCIISWS